MPANPPLTPELVIAAYCRGLFPMAASRRGRIHWFCPDPRAILPLDGFHLPRSLAKIVRGGRFAVTRDRAFEQVIAACSQPRANQPETWINPRIVEVYTQLHRAGLAHSVEAWSRDDDGDEPTLVGGLYGVSLGSAFFGESMFSRRTDASKVCLVHLVEHLRTQGFTLLDVQFQTDHLARFGVTEIPRDDYLARLEQALERGNVVW
jgi:leucyl/phenylalanyl-tRNA--protein transferase